MYNLYTFVKHFIAFVQSPATLKRLLVSIHPNSSVLCHRRFYQNKTCFRSTPSKQSPPTHAEKKKHNLLTSNHPRHYRGSNKTQQLRRVTALPNVAGQCKRAFPPLRVDLRTSSSRRRYFAYSHKCVCDSSFRRNKISFSMK